MIIDKIVSETSEGVKMLTCAGRVDGIGAQVYAIFTTQIMAKLLGFTYVHTPFQRVDHRLSNIKRKKWVDRWERYFNLGEGHLRFENLKADPKYKHLRCHYHHKLHNLSMSTKFRPPLEDGIYFIKKALDVINNFWDNDRLRKVYVEQLELFRKQFWTTVGSKHDCVYYTSSSCSLQQVNDETVNVAIHIRRGDVAKGTKIVMQERFLSNEYFYRIIKHIATQYLHNHNSSLNFHIFSEGSLKKDFPELQWVDQKHHLVKHRNGGEVTGNRLYVHLNGDPLVAFHHLVEADVLVMSKSCFSYVAGLLNPNSVKWYTPFWIKPPIFLNENWNIWIN